MQYGYIQILTMNDLSKRRILFTPNEEYINNNIIYYVIDTFEIEFNKIFAVFSHAKNINLIGKIKDGTLTVIGDGSKLLLLQKLSVSYDIEPTEIILKADTEFLKKNGLPLF